MDSNNEKQRLRPDCAEIPKIICYRVSYRINSAGFSEQILCTLLNGNQYYWEQDIIINIYLDSDFNEYQNK